MNICICDIIYSSLTILQLLLDMINTKYIITYIFKSLSYLALFNSLLWASIITKIIYDEIIKKIQLR